MGSRILRLITTLRRQKSIADCRLPIADCRLPIADCRLPIADCRLPIADCRLPIAVPIAIGSRLPIAAPDTGRIGNITGQKVALSP
jgi:hypothetical protein